MISIEEEIRIISKGVAEIIDVHDLEVKIKKARNEGRPLIAKLGLDPSAPDIHLGHAVVLRKLKQLQDIGHKAVIIIGDFTGMIGDPTGKSKTRKQLSREEVLVNAKTYEEQIFKILDRDKTQVTFNGDWLSKLCFKDVITLASKCTVARMLERDDFKKRFSSHQEIGVHEFFYPLMQAYDSVAIEADIELGGTDQRFNILMGRGLQKSYNQQSQVAVFMPLLEGTDGIEKMSKSLGNYIGINEKPNDIYGKVMSIPDVLLIKYYELATDVHPDVVDRIRQDLNTENVNPRDIKMGLAREIVRLYYGEEQSEAAEQHFKTVFQNKGIPDVISTIEVASSELTYGEIGIIELIIHANFAASKSDARRLVQQGAVKLNCAKVDTINKFKIKEGTILQVGKLKFGKVTIK
jgi:tyrosyl-tRNA synthetase